MVNIDPLIELVGFLHDKNPQVRAVAASVHRSTRSKDIKEVTDISVAKSWCHTLPKSNLFLKAMRLGRSPTYASSYSTIPSVTPSVLALV